ncbi:MAG TPA: MOSC N-terminal beta barrel domain-containing protein [Gaiellaceae bacterium]|nr:MOSC N-terminal beta barrel domain-containing protein [Gaiellaceae bacterium]
MATSEIGTVASLWRYPVKSMMGEEVNASLVTDRGLVGDRAFALVDRDTGKIVSAKEPRKWARMFEFRAAYTQPLGGNGLPPVRIALPDGTSVASDLPDVNAVLSRELGREVALAATAPEAPRLEEYWPDIEGLAFREVVTDEAMPPGTFFDLAVVHVLTTATIDRLRELYLEGRFEVRRFRPNVVIATEERGFVENDWIGSTLALGDDMRLEVTGPCPRCVMTTLPQYDLPKDPGILRAAAKHNAANVGVYASVVHGGTLRRGDPVWLE